jgi:di/tricarboxylate transporter
MDLQIIFVVAIILALVVSLYSEIIKASHAFVFSALAMVLVGVIDIDELLLGLSNKQIITIFLLIILTTGIKKSIGNGFFNKLFHLQLTPSAFRLRMMVFVASTSAFLNNTPIVALMLPFVKKWSDERGLAASKFLIPLSFATILGGMITLAGTSTNLVLNGLIGSAGLPMLIFTDFLYLGLLVCVSGIIYLYFFSDIFLPNRVDTKTNLQQNIQEYIIETLLTHESKLIGKTIEDAGLRHLQDLYLVEIHRADRVIPIVDPSERLEENDRLFFAGNASSILKLINPQNGLVFPESSHVSKNKFFELTEAVIPSGSNLIGESLKTSSFRNNFKASVISIFRNGNKVTGNLGEVNIVAGDLFLLLANSSTIEDSNNKNLIFLGRKGIIEQESRIEDSIPGVLALVLLGMGIFGVLDLFVACSIGIGLLISLNVLDKNLISSSVDLDLLLILVSSLALGLALSESGTAGYFIEKLLFITGDQAVWINLMVLFLFTVLLTSLITNVAAVSIMFPFALAMSEQLASIVTPFFVIIAFASSADFMTPIGYQTNLMVMGPGNYKFKDYTKIGFPLTIIYTVTVLLFVIHYYHL